MAFVTKIDYSDNRQVKQFELTNTQLSGTTTFGVEYSGLTSGVNPDEIAITSFLTGVTSTFSGNTSETQFTFGDSRMNVGVDTLEVITSLTSGDTQLGIGYQGKDSFIVHDNVVFSSYTGSSYDIYVTSIEETSPNIWTGTTLTDTLNILSGTSIDFSGRTIWVDVKGITKTEKLILSDAPEVDETLVTVLARTFDGEIREVSLSAYTNQNDYITEEYL